MTTYQISIDIDQAGLQGIYNAGQVVTLVKSVTNFPGDTGNLPIAWLSFQPLESNIITWDENYAVYATTTQLKSGALIVMASSQDAQQGIMYDFEQGSFNNASGGAPDVYNVCNLQPNGSFNFGLAQTAVVNGVNVSAAVSACPVLYNESATFTPIETISMYLSSYQNNGVVISQVASNALALTLTSQSPNASVGFSDANNTFVLNSVAPRSLQDLMQKRLKVA